MYISDPDVLFGTDLAASPDQSRWAVTMADGSQRTETLRASPPNKADPFVFTKRWVSSEPVKAMGGDWLAFAPAKALPLTLRDFDKPFRFFRVDNSCVAYIQLKTNSDENGQSIGNFVSVTRKALRTNPPCAVVLDLRFDDRGDYMNTVGFAKDLPKLVASNGPILVLTGPATFSAGITTAAFVKQAGAERVKIVGEEVGDRLSFYSEGNRGCLPNHAICVSYERGKHDYTGKCEDWDRCFWLNKLYPVRVATLDPDERTKMDFASWNQGHDVAAERALALLKVPASTR